MRKYTLLLLLFIASHVWSASEMSLIVVMNDGTKVEFVLRNKPEISFIGTFLTIEDQSNVEYYSIDLVKELYFSKIHSGIEQLLQENGCRIISQSDDVIVIEGLQKGERISIFNKDGVLMPNGAEYEPGRATVNIGQLPKGVYIIRVGNRRTFKISKK